MTERELAKGATYRLAILRHAEEVTGKVAKTCAVSYWVAENRPDPLVSVGPMSYSTL